MRKITLEVEDATSVKAFKFEPGDYILVAGRGQYIEANLVAVIRQLLSKGIRIHVLIGMGDNAFKILEVPKNDAS